MTAFLNLIRRHSEIVTLPLAVLLWIVLPGIMRLWDPTSEPLDSGVLSLLIYGVMVLLLTNFFAWFLLRLAMPKLYRYLVCDQFEDELLNQPALCSQRVYISLFFFALYFLGSLLAILLPIMAL